MIILSAIALLCTAVWGYCHFRDRDKRMLEALTGELESIVAKRPGKSNALALLDAATPERVFTGNVRIISDLPRLDRNFSLKELSQLLITMKKSCHSAAVDIDISSITFDSEHRSAQIAGTAFFTVDSGKNNVRELREIELTCNKTNGKWKIAGITATQVIER